MVFVANAWAPLLALAGPALVACAIPRRSWGERQSRRRLLGYAAISLCVALGIVVPVVRLLSSVSVGQVVSAGGGIFPSSPLPVLTLSVLGVSVCAGAPRRAVTGDPGMAFLVRRLRVLTLTPLSGMVVGVSLLSPMRTMGTVSYYLLKFLMGFEMVLAGLVPTACALVLAGVVRAGGPRRGLVAATVVTAAVAFGQVQVLTVWTTPSGLLHSTRPDRATSLGEGFSVSGVAEGIVREGYSSSRPAVRHDYLGIGDARAPAVLFADEWYHALRADLESADATEDGLAGREVQDRSARHSRSCACCLRRRTTARSWSSLGTLHRYGGRWDRPCWPNGSSPTDSRRAPRRPRRVRSPSLSCETAPMDATGLRAQQAPLREKYRDEPATALTFLTPRATSPTRA